MDDWLGYDKPPSKVSFDKSKPTTVVLADDLEFATSHEYSFGAGTAPKNIILVADSVRLLQTASIDLSGTGGRTLAERSGGSLIIIARKFSCEKQGRLKFVSVGSAGRQGDQRTKAGGHGGQLVLVTEENGETTGMSCIEARTDGGPGFSLSDRRGHKGGVHSVGDMHEVIRAGGIETDGTYMESLWALHFLKQIAYELNGAVLNGRMSQATALFLSMKEVDGYPAHSDHRDERSKLMTEIMDQLEKVSPLWVEQLSVEDAEGNAREVDLFVDVQESRVYLAPTELLVQVKKSGATARPPLGFLSADPSRPEEIVISFDAKLTVDPWLEQAVKKELIVKKKGEEYGGVFTRWNLRAHGIEELGIKDSKLKVNGTNLHVELTLDAEKAGLVLHRLTNIGFQFTCDWEYDRDSKVKGAWDGPALLLTRRDTSALVSVVEDEVTNRSGIPVAIVYAMFSAPESPEQAYAFEDAVVLQPGESGKLPLPPGIDGASAKLKIPPEAIEYVEDIDPLKDFEVPKANIADKVTVSNKLGYDQQRGGALEFVEITMTYASDQDNNDGGITRGPYRLAPVGAEGSEITVSFIKPLKGNRRIKISGIAFYEGDSRQTLKESNFQDLTIKITEAMLPPATVNADSKNKAMDERRTTTFADGKRARP